MPSRHVRTMFVSHLHVFTPTADAYLRPGRDSNPNHMSERCSLATFMSSHRLPTHTCDPMFADKGRTEKRVTEGTRVAFLAMAFQICMIFYLLREQLQKASKILQHLYALLDVVKRRAAKNKVDPGLFREGRIQSSITSRAAVGSDKVTLVHGSKCFDVTGETNSKAVTTMCEAMNVIGADLKIKFKIPVWKKVALGAAAASAIGLTAAMGAGAAIGGIASLGTVAALVIADHQGNERLLKVYAIFLETEGKTVEFESNYLKAVLLSTKIVDRSDMTESQLQRIIDDVKYESRASVIKQVERAVMDKLPDISKGDIRLGWSGNIHDAANFDYEARAWLHDDSVKDVNDSILIACLQFGMRNLLRDVFILGVIGPEDKSKKGLMKLVFPNAVHELEQKSCDMVLYDGSEYMQSTLPVMLFPSGKTKAIEAALGLWTRSCSAFICVVDYTRDIPDLEDLEVVAGLCVPVLLCINTNGRLLGREAERAIDTYKSNLSYDLRDLVQVILVDVSRTDKSPWITGGGDVKYWVPQVRRGTQRDVCGEEKHHVNRPALRAARAAHFRITEACLLSMAEVNRSNRTSAETRCLIGLWNCDRIQSKMETFRKKETPHVTERNADRHSPPQLRRKAGAAVPVCKRESVVGDLVEVMRILGVFLQSNLKWNAHVDYICTKSSQRLFFLRRLKHFHLDIEDLVSSDRIERIQRRAVRIILGPDYFNYAEACSQLGLSTLHERREELTLKAQRRGACSDMYRVRLGIEPGSPRFIVDCSNHYTTRRHTSPIVNEPRGHRK
ncbi:hypothetical protein Bbelb_289860 [Branchiostoma belcheri]|nr:hypothetical protein Bbelb_289860 [Branchiostoma belcheri]